MKQSGKLDNISIENCINTAKKELEKYGVTGDDMLRFGLSLEEILLGYREHLGEDAGYTLHIAKKAVKS